MHLNHNHSNLPNHFLYIQNHMVHIPRLNVSDIMMHFDKNVLYVHNVFYHSLFDNTGQPIFFSRSLEMSDKRVVMQYQFKKTFGIAVHRCIFGLIVS